MEALHATCGIMLPYAVGEIIRSMTKSTGDSKPILDAISQPFMLFAALSLGEVIFGRLSGFLPVEATHNGKV